MSKLREGHLDLVHLQLAEVFVMQFYKLPGGSSLVIAQSPRSLSIFRRRLVYGLQVMYFALCKVLSFVFMIARRTHGIDVQWGRFPSYGLLILEVDPLRSFSLYLIALEMMSLEVFISSCSHDVVLWSTFWLVHITFLWPISYLTLLARERYSKCLAMITYFIVLLGTRNRSEFKFVSFLERDSTTK